MSISQRHFHSLSDSDMIDLGRRWFVNLQSNGLADFYWNRFRDERIRNFSDRGLMPEERLIKPTPLKKIKNQDGTFRFEQKRIKCVKKVPAIRWDQDMLTEMTFWQIDIKSGEAQMFVDDSKKQMLLRMYDPMQVVNLSRGDQRRLLDTPCSVVDFWRVEERRYRNILSHCLQERIHANSTRLLFNG